MKRMLGVAAITTCVLCTNIVSLAAETPQSNFERVNPEAVIIRENVPIEEAVQDETFNLQISRDSATVEARATNWNVWGTRFDTSGTGGTRGAIPIGYSEHVKDGVVLETWHYTRTYLGDILRRGDSGRIWGSGTVRAEGTFCDYGVWDAHTHIVKYGTEE